MGNPACYGETNPMRAKALGYFDEKPLDNRLFEPSPQSFQHFSNIFYSFTVFYSRLLTAFFYPFPEKNSAVTIG